MLLDFLMDCEIDTQDDAFSDLSTADENSSFSSQLQLTTVLTRTQSCVDVEPKPATSHSLNPQSSCSPTFKGNRESFEHMETHLSICVLITD
jgi:hypothetical protein